MNIKLLLPLAVIVCFNAQAQSSSYTNLVATYGQPASLSVSTGQVARIVSARLPGGYGAITIALGANSFAYTGNDLQGTAGNSGTGTAGPPTVTGPAVVTLSETSPSYSCFCTIEVTCSAQQFTPSTAVVIPADSGGPVNIILESSVDLVTWTAALPGTYGTSTTNRFFRVRAQRTQ